MPDIVKVVNVANMAFKVAVLFEGCFMAYV